MRPALLLVPCCSPEYRKSRYHPERPLPPDDEDTQMAAEDYLRMYIAKVKGMEPLEPFQPEEEINKDILA